MKLRNLLFMCTVLLAGTSATAEVAERQKPVPQKSALQYDEALYLYNIGSKQFLKGANDWSTRGSVGEAGYKVWLSKHLEDGAWDNKTIILKDSIENGDPKGKILMVWFAGNGDMWVDWKNQNDTLWTILPQADDVYRFTVGEGNPVYNTATYPGVYVGTRANEIASNTRLYWNLGAVDTSYVDWYFVKPADYAAYEKEVDVYLTAQALKAVLDDANQRGVNVSAQESVYSNLSSTKEDLEAATAAARKAIADAVSSATNASNPKNMTSLITNPSYDTNKNDGWSGTAPGFQRFTNAEHYNKTFDTYQDIENAPKGVYALTLSAFYRSGNTETAYQNYKNNTGYNAKLYAKAGTDSLNANIMNSFQDAQTEPTATGETSKTDGGNVYYVPNNMESAAAYFNLGLYKDNKLFFATEDGTMRIGVKKVTGIGNDWLLFDNWQLTYYGNGADAYALWMKDVKESARDLSQLPETSLLSKSLREDYNAYVAGLTSASSKAEVIEAIETLKQKSADVDSNMVAWAAYEEALTKGKLIANDPQVNGQDKDELADYCDLEAEDIINALDLTTEEVKAETQKLVAMTDAAVRNGIAEGADVSDKYLVNADFEKTSGTGTGWIKKAASGGNVNYGGTSDNKCYEAWNNKDFDIYQEVKEAPVGVYELSVQGFYRYRRGNNAYSAYTDGTANNDVVSIYVNNNQTHFKSVFDEPVKYNGNGAGEMYKNEGGNKPYINPDSTYWYPNDMANSAIAFANGLYKVSSFGVVAKQGDVLRVGVKGATNQMDDSWAIWDNFKMVFQGTKAEVVKPLLEAEIKNVTTAMDNSGIYGKDAKALANTTIADGNTALAQTDGKVMFDALTALLTAKDSIGKSAAIFKALAAKQESLGMAIQTSNADDATKMEAGAINEKMLNNTDMTDEEAQNLIKQADAMITKLAIPAEAKDASDSHPVDMTSLIRTPNFDKEGANSVEGWNASGYSFGNDDEQKAALALEFYNKTFDLNQTIEGIPNGTYEVSVMGFYRYGNADKDNAKFEANETIGNAYLYTVVEGDSVHTPLKLLSSGKSDDLGYQGTVKLSGSDQVVPNSMVAASNYFNDAIDGGTGVYKNTAIVKVTDGKLTIGVRQIDKVDNDWVILDTWKLTYFGENSAKTPSEDVRTGIEIISDNSASVAVVKTEYFSINGAKQAGLTKGLNIVKQTLENGTVKVSKVIVR